MGESHSPSCCPSCCSGLRKRPSPLFGKEWLPGNGWAANEPASFGKSFQKQIAIASFPGLRERDWPKAARLSSCFMQGQNSPSVGSRPEPSPPQPESLSNSHMTSSFLVRVARSSEFLAKAETSGDARAAARSIASLEQGCARPHPHPGASSREGFGAAGRAREGEGRGPRVAPLRHSRPAPPGLLGAPGLGRGGVKLGTRTPLAQQA